MKTTLCLAVSCMAIMAQSVLTQELPQRCLAINSGPDNPRNSECGFIPLKDGRIMFMYTRFYGKNADDDGAADLMARYSSDGGLTWTQEDRLIVKNDAAQNVMETSLLRLQDGRLALFYNRKNSAYDCRPVMRYSTDEGETWSEGRYCITDPVKYFVLNNDRVIQTRSGRIILPLALHDRVTPGPGTWGDVDALGQIVCCMSDDGGETWRLSKKMFRAYNAEGKQISTQEPGIVELKDGRLMMFIRSNGGSQLICHSSDDGETWSEPKPSVLIGPESPASIKRLSTGDLLAVWNDHTELRNVFPDLKRRRVPLSTAISKDDGQTWELFKNLEGNPTGWYCYIAIQPLEDSVLLGYCYGGILNSSRITKVPHAWLYSKEPQKPLSRKDSLYSMLPVGPFTRLESQTGIWTAAEGQAEVYQYDDGRGKGIHIMGGVNMGVELELPKPTRLEELAWLAVERFTSRPPYMLSIEAWKDGQWVLVGGQDHNTGNLKKHKIVFTTPELVTTKLRIRCTGLLGAIIADPFVTYSLNGFFND